MPARPHRCSRTPRTIRFPRYIYSPFRTEYYSVNQTNSNSLQNHARRALGLSARSPILVADSAPGAFGHAAKRENKREKLIYECRIPPSRHVPRHKKRLYLIPQLHSLCVPIIPFFFREGR